MIEDREKELERLFAAYVDRLNCGEKLDADTVLAENPLFGEELLTYLESYLDAAGVDSGEPLRALGDYTLRRQIGRGGMGVVYEAWENSMDRSVALKVLPAGIAADDKAVSRFVREARLAGKLNHPNVVGVYGMGVKEQTPYYAMEFVEGETLAQLLTRLKDAAPETDTAFGKKDDARFFLNLAEALADVADGLQHAHSKGIIHRDIKPSNLILDRDSRLRILDFGLARLEGQESLTISGDVVGTPQYMSPEQARRKKIPVDHRTDVYSLGATLYETLTLRPPFSGKDHNDTLSQIIERDPVEPRKVNPRVPKDLETIVLKCLRKEAGDRYGTAEALGQDLRRFVRGDPIEARVEATWAQVARRARRHRRALVTGAVLLAMSFATGWFAWKGAREARLRALADYGPKVLGALEKLQTGSLSSKAESGEPLTLDPRRWVFGAGRLGALPPATVRTVEDAVGELGEAALSVPEKTEAWYYRARGRVLLGRLDDALDDLEAALRRAPGFAPAAALREAILERRGDAGAAARRNPGEDASCGSWSEAWLSARESMREARWEDASTAFGELIGMGARGEEPYIGCTVESCLGRAGARLEMKEYARALQDIAVARYLWPASVEASLLEGKALHLMGDTERALLAFERTHEEALHKDEAAIAVWTILIYLNESEASLAWADKVSVEYLKERFRAESFLEMGKCREAVDAARRSLELEPGYEWSRIILALALYDCLGRYEEAQEHVEAALRLSPSSPDASFHAGRFFWFRGKLDAAVRHYRRAIELDPRRAIAHGDLGLCLIFRGNPGEGLKHLEEGAAMDPWNPYVLNDLASGLELLSENERALSVCSLAIRIAPRFAWPHTRRGKILEKEGRFEEAIEEYRTACGLTPRRQEPFVRLGMLLEENGEPLGALSQYVEALEINRADAPLRLRIERLHRAQRAGLGEAGDARLRAALLDADTPHGDTRPSDCPPEGETRDESAGTDGEDLAWLLERLRTGEPIRIDCGGGDGTASDGTSWSRDRFAVGGRGGVSHWGEVKGTDLDPIYRSERNFPDEDGAFVGYRIPVPAGKYLVILHFMEGHWRFRGARVFDVLLENVNVLPRHEPLGAGFATAGSRDFVVETTDDLLEVQFIREEGEPSISALEIERLY